MSAWISDDGVYRYLLGRRWGDGASLAVVMLNPSTADAELDDPTIRRCRSFAQREGFGALVVANLYAYRAAKPMDLWLAEDPVGPLNDDVLAELVQVVDGGPILCAWGSNAKADRVKAFHTIASGADLVHLGLTAGGLPRHPLYVRGDQPLARLDP